MRILLCCASIFAEPQWRIFQSLQQVSSILTKARVSLAFPRSTLSVAGIFQVSSETWSISRHQKPPFQWNLHGKSCGKLFWYHRSPSEGNWTYERLFSSARLNCLKKGIEVSRPYKSNGVVHRKRNDSTDAAVSAELAKIVSVNMRTRDLNSIVMMLERSN